MKTLRILKMLVPLAISFASAGSVQATEPAKEESSICHLLMPTFDKPEARLVVDPVVVVGVHAVADWAQGERGGRALLMRQGTEWGITLCAGDGLKQAKVLRDAGTPAAEANALAKGLATAEAKLPAAQRAKFSTFDDVLRMDAKGQHPPGHKH